MSNFDLKRNHEFKGGTPASTFTFVPNICTGCHVIYMSVLQYIHLATIL